MIKLLNVNKFYNRKKSNEIHVINNTSLDLEDKGLVTFLGHSGCGKTTLLNAIGGLDNVNSGEIYIDDKKINTRRSGKRDEIRNTNVGYIFQNYNLIDDATVFENVAIVLRMMGLKDKAQIEERVMYILKRVGIDRYRNRPAKMLSGGERQRVGIARAIVKNPKIIIADEPTGNLDSKNTIEIMNIIKAISKEKLVILVTHEKEIAKFYASRIIEIVDGKVVSDNVNEHDNGLDYHMDNKIYLKDMENQQVLVGDNINVKFYGDEKLEKPLEVKVVIRNNNIYIETSEKLGAGSEVVELVDDHYKKLSKDIYEEYSFDYESMVDSNFKPKYTSIFNPITLMIAGFKKVLSYSTIKKILLLGFVFASAFSIYAVSAILGITDIKDSEFVQVNKNYLTINVGEVTPELYEKYSEMEGVDYALPGDSKVSFVMTLDDFYQSSDRTTAITGSLSSKSLIDKMSLVAGETSNGKREIIIDKLTVGNMLEEGYLKMVGIDSYEKLVGRKVSIPNLGEFEIVGVTDQGSPSIYVSDKMMLQIIQYSVHEDSEMYGYYEDSDYTGEVKVVDYELVRDNDDISIYAGREPENDYEAIVSDDYQWSLYIGSTLDTEVNGKKLTVVGFYTDKRNNDKIYVNQKTALTSFMKNQQSITISPENKFELYNSLKAEKVKVTDNYQADKDEYIESIKSQIIATLVSSALILFISLVEIYLILRASFLSRIKDVGVLRAIGLKKKDIYKMFMGEILAISIITTLPAMTIMAYILNEFTKLPFLRDQFMMNWFIYVGCLIMVIGFNLIAGLLPAFNTMRKTPAEILSRNDVN